MSWLAIPAVPVAGFTILFGLARVERWLARVTDTSAPTVPAARSELVANVPPGRSAAS